MQSTVIRNIRNARGFLAVSIAAQNTGFTQPLNAIEIHSIRLMGSSELPHGALKANHAHSNPGIVLVPELFNTMAGSAKLNR